MSELTDCINSLTAKDIIRSIAKTANGVPFYLQVNGGGFCAEYQRIYNDLEGSGTAPGDAIAAAQNTMVCGLVDDGVWAKLDVFYVYAQTTNDGGEALMNWVTTGLYNAVAVNAPAFVALEGFTGNGTNAYINTNFIPATHGVNYKRDDASFGVYVRTNVDEGAYDIGAKDAAWSIAIISRNAGNAVVRTNCVTAVQGANTDSRGMIIANRLDSTDNDLYRNKIKIINGATASTALVTKSVYTLSYNNNDVPGGGGSNTKQVSMAFLGAGFTQTDVDNMTDRFETYMDSNGKGVIP